jgi:hypothetical protein
MTHITLFRKQKLALACLLAFAITSVQAFEKKAEDTSENDSRVEVEWVEPKKYTDLRDRNFSTERFRKHVFSTLEEHLAELAEELPEGQHLKMKVTDVDLAGRVEPGSFSGLVATHDNIRIMRDIDIPRMKFEYTLVDSAGAVLKQEEVHIKDMNYLNTTRSFMRSRPFSYEKQMLTRWFEKNFENV